MFVISMESLDIAQQCLILKQDQKVNLWLPFSNRRQIHKIQHFYKDSMVAFLDEILEPVHKGNTTHEI